MLSTAGDAAGCTLSGARLLRNRSVGPDLRTMGDEGGAQCRKLALRLQPAEALGGLEHGGSSPAQRHRGVAPALDVAADPADRAHDVLDDVGAGQRAAEFLRQAKPHHGEDLVEPLEDGASDARRLAFQRAGETGGRMFDFAVGFRF